MRAGLIASASFHVVLLLWGFISFPDATPFETDPVDALPVELVTLAELTRLREGDQTAPDREVEAPRQAEIPRQIEPEPQVEPEPPGVNEQVLETPPVEAATEVAALPQPEAEPEPAPQAEPEPAPVEPKPEPVAEEPPAPTPVLLKPRSKPKRRKRADKVAKDDLTDQVAAVISKEDPSGGGKQRPRQPASLGSRRGNDNAQLSQNELDALRGQISQCWNPPVGAIEAEGLKVLIQFKLNRDGTVDSPPRVLNRVSNPAFRPAADSARRAILRCQPYALPADKYNAWQDVKVTFDPREMFGG